MTVLITGPSSVEVSLDEIDWKRSDERKESVHQMRSGRRYQYVWGEHKGVDFNAHFVSSADACTVNSWWGAGSPVVIEHQDRTEVLSGYLVNKHSPFAQFVESDMTFWRGKIELETY